MCVNAPVLEGNLVNCLSEILWYIDGYHDTLARRACGVPDQLAHFQNYYKPVDRKHKEVDKTNLKEEVLRNHATTLLLLCEDSFLNREIWTSVCQLLVKLGESLMNYSEYLVEQKSNVETKVPKLASDREHYEVLSQKHHITPGSHSR